MRSVWLIPQPSAATRIFGSVLKKKGGESEGNMIRVKSGFFFKAVAFKCRDGFGRLRMMVGGQFGVLKKGLLCTRDIVRLYEARDGCVQRHSGRDFERGER